MTNIELINLFYFFNVIFLILYTFFFLRYKQKINHYFVHLVNFFILSEAITIEYSILDELIIIFYFFIFLINIKKFNINKIKLFIRNNNYIILISILLIVYFSLNILFEVYQSKDFRLLRFIVVYFSLAMLFIISYNNTNKNLLNINNYQIIFFLSGSLLLFLIVQGLVSEIFFYNGKIITQGYSWPGTARTSILIPIFIISAYKVSLSQKKPLKIFLPCVIFSITWCMYYDTKTGLLLSIATLIYVCLNINLKKILILLFILILTYLANLIHSHRDGIFNKSINLIELVTGNLKHNFGAYIFENSKEKSQREQVENNIINKNNQTNFLKFKINVSPRIAQYIALQNYLNESSISKILFGNGYYSHKTIMVPYIKEIYTNFEINKNNSAYIDLTRIDDQDIKIFRTTSVIALIIDVGIIGILILILTIFLSLIKNVLNQKSISQLIIIFPIIFLFFIINISDSLLIFSLLYYQRLFKI